MLKIGKSASSRVIFKTTRIGNLTNTATVGYNNTTIANSTNSTEVVNITPPKNDTQPDENKTTPANKPVSKNETVSKNDKTIIKTHMDEKATGNPLIALLMVLAILPMRRFKK